MVCPNCKREVNEGEKFCSQCGTLLTEDGEKDNTAENNIGISGEENSEAEESIVTSENENNVKEKKSHIKLIIALSATGGVVVILLVLWFLSGLLLVNLSNNAIETGDLDKAEKYLDFACPFGINRIEVKTLKNNVIAVDEGIDVVEEYLEKNDYVSAVNDSKKLLDTLPNSTDASEIYAEASEKLCTWLNELYSEKEFSEAAHAFSVLTEDVLGDASNTQLESIMTTFGESTAMFLDSALKYYNSFEPDKAIENVKIVLAFEPENQTALDLQSKLDTYSSNKTYIDEAQAKYNSGDYSVALNSFDKADDYTKMVYKDLRDKIVTAKNIEEIDARYSGYVGTFDAYLEMGTDRITITKIENGRIWFEANNSGDDYWVSAQVNGASIANGSVSYTSTGSAIDYGSGILNATKDFQTRDTITLKDGCIYHTYTLGDGIGETVLYRY